MFENIEKIATLPKKVESDFERFGELMKQISELTEEATLLRSDIIKEMELAGKKELKNSFGTLKEKLVSRASINTSDFIKAFGQTSHDALTVGVTKAKTLFGKELTEKGLIEIETVTQWEYRKS